jgi:hypothetical protein
MPKAYEKMRDKFTGEGMAYKAAQGKAAAIYNSRNPDAPVTGKSEKKKKAKKKSKSKARSGEKGLMDQMVGGKGGGYY